jgi:hypothetical protein
MDATAIDKIFKGGETMTLSKHGTEIPTEQRDLLATLVALRGDVMAEGDKLLGRGRDLIQRDRCARVLAKRAEPSVLPIAAPL